MTVSEQIEAFILEQEDWKAANLKMFRELVHQVLPEVEEQWKWNVPVFAKAGKQFCAMSVFKEHTKFNFFTGAKLKDQHGLFNSGLDSKQHRSINMSHGDSIDTDKLKDLLSEAAQSV